jgi:hypothetical protein
MPDVHDTVRQKVLAIFTALASDRAERLRGDEPPSSEVLDAFRDALVADHSPEVARAIAIHLVDWNWEAAFIVAVHLFPEQFKPEELLVGTDMLLSHAPNHLAAAATIVGHPIEDVFEVGVPDSRRMAAKLEEAQKTQAARAAGYHIGPWLRIALIVFVLAVIAMAVIVPHYLK